MSSSFRPHESAGIDDGLRIRLEGQSELLEDALPLLDWLQYLLARAENSRDDVATLHECVNQLPRIDEAIDRANKHEHAVALTQAVRTRKQHALMAANERLVTLGRREEPSLRSALTVLLDLLRRQGTPPKPGEEPLIASGGPPWTAAFFAGGVGAMIVWLAWHTVALSACLGAVVCILLLRARRAAGPWVLFPDRIFFPASWPRLSTEIAPGSIRRVEGQGHEVELELANGSVFLPSREPKQLITWLRLLSSPWLAALKSPASAFVLVDAVDDSSQTKGRAIISKEGVLFVPGERLKLLAKALTPERLPAEPTLDDVLRLIAHLPEGRWDELGEHLEKSADAKWIPREELVREENAVRFGEKRVRLVLSQNPRRLEAEEILKAL